MKCLLSILSFVLTLAVCEAQSVRHVARRLALLEAASGGAVDYTFGGKLISGWLFDGDLLDVASTNNGSFAGDAQIISNALYCDGNGDSMDVPHSAELEPSTIAISAWFFAETYGENAAGLGRVVSKRTAAAHGYFVALNKNYGGNASNVNFSVNSGALFYRTPNASVLTGQWYHVVGLYDGTNASIWLDGVEYNKTAYSTPIAPSGNPLKVGASSATELLDYKGFIDAVRIYPTLTSNEIVQLYNEPGQGGNP